MIKYRIHEVAKDFNVPSKVISQILTDYIAPPKNHMQVLENNELDVIFDYMTQHNQVASLQDIFNVQPKAEAKETKPKAAEQAKPAPPQSPAKSPLQSRRISLPPSRARRLPSSPHPSRRISRTPRVRSRRSALSIPAAALPSISRSTTKSSKTWPARKRTIIICAAATRRRSQASPSSARRHSLPPRSAVRKSAIK